MKLNVLLLTFFSITSQFQIKSQSFSGLNTISSLPSSPNDVDSKKIHLVLLSEGYVNTTADANLFNGIPGNSNMKGDTEEFLWDLVNKRSPFKEYIN